MKAAANDWAGVKFYICHMTQFFTNLHAWSNNYESAIGIDFGVTNTFYEQMNSQI